MTAASNPTSAPIQLVTVVDESNKVPGEKAEVNGAFLNVPVSVEKVPCQVGWPMILLGYCASDGTPVDETLQKRIVIYVDQDDLYRKVGIYIRQQS